MTKNELALFALALEYLKKYQEYAILIPIDRWTTNECIDHISDKTSIRVNERDRAILLKVI